MAESAVTVAFCCLLALAFNGLIWWWKGGTAGLQFATGYLLEWSLSMDNVFVFAVIFRYFQVPKIHQYRILYWGILGAILLRLAFILAGAALISRFQFILPAVRPFPDLHGLPIGMALVRADRSAAESRLPLRPSLAAAGRK